MSVADDFLMWKNLNTTAYSERLIKMNQTIFSSADHPRLHRQSIINHRLEEKQLVFISLAGPTFAIRSHNRYVHFMDPWSKKKRCKFVHVILVGVIVIVITLAESGSTSSPAFRFQLAGGKTEPVAKKCWCHFLTKLNGGGSMPNSASYLKNRHLILKLFKFLYFVTLYISDFSNFLISKTIEG